MPACYISGAEIAVTTRNEFWLKSRDSAQQSKRPFVAGSIGPYGAFLADGSEYHGRYIDDIEHKVSKHTCIMLTLCEGCSICIRNRAVT